MTDILDSIELDPATKAAVQSQEQEQGIADIKARLDALEKQNKQLTDTNARLYAELVDAVRAQPAEAPAETVQVQQGVPTQRDINFESFLSSITRK